MLGHSSFGTGLILLLTLVLVVGAPALAEQGDDIDWENAPASEIHDRLWRAKVSGLLDKEVRRQLQLQETAVNTQTEYDVLFYDVTIRVNDTTEIIYGYVEMVAEPTVLGVDEVQVDLQSALTVDSIVSDAGSLTYSRVGDLMTVELDRPYTPGETFAFTTYYHGHPTEGGFQGFSFDTRNGAPVISSLSEPYFARSWWPCKDRMDDKPDSMDIAIQVDTSLYVASNGTLDSTVAHGDNTHTFYYRVRYPIVTYLFSVAISEYTVWTDEYLYNSGQDTLPLVHAVYPDRYVYSLSTYDVTPQIMGAFESEYGPYPFRTEKYGHANFEWGGGMEHQTMTSMTGSSFGFSTPVVAHELAHQWWGDMITCESWQDIWLNEGWASYSEALWYLESSGWASYHSYMNGMRYTGGGTVYVDDTTDVWRIFNGGLSYDKGAWVVHMLRGVLGDSKFFDGVDAYYNSVHQYGSATTEDFKNVFEAATGEELDYYFDQWVHGTYLPNYVWSYYEEASDSTGWDVYLEVNQTQTTNPTVFTMPVDVFIDLLGPGDDTLTLWVDERTELFRLNFPNQVASMELDPSDWILKNESEEAWGVRLITKQSEISDGTQSMPYADTLETKGGAGVYAYILTGGSLPSGLSLGEDGIISGTPSDTGSFEFTAYVTDNFQKASDWEDFTIYIEAAPGEPGDFDNDGNVNIVDLTSMVGYLFDGGAAPTNPNLADVDASCSINIVDLTYLVAFLFDSGPAPQMGCVE